MALRLRFDRDPKIFSSHVKSFLVEHEAENNLVLGLIAGIIAGVQTFSDEPPLLASVEDLAIHLVALRTPPHNLVVSTSRNSDAVSVLARGLHAAGHRLPGVTASEHEAETFAHAWSDITGAKTRCGRAQRIYRLDRVVPPRPMPGHLRQCGDADLALATKWMNGFDRDTALETPSDPRRFIGHRDRGLFFWVDGAPVAMVGCSGPTPNGIRIGAVYTPPELRRRGYASACVAALSQRMLNEGKKFCFLYTDLANATSNHIYQEIGYRPVCDAPMLRFDG